MQNNIIDKIKKKKTKKIITNALVQYAYKIIQDHNGLGIRAATLQKILGLKEEKDAHDIIRRARILKKNGKLGKYIYTGPEGYTLRKTIRVANY